MPKLAKPRKPTTSRTKATDPLAMPEELGETSDYDRGSFERRLPDGRTVQVKATKVKRAQRR